MDIKTKVVNYYGGPMIDEGWIELVENGFHPKIDGGLINTEEFKTIIAYDRSGYYLGVLSFWVDNLVLGGDAIVQMVYVKPEYRKEGISVILHEALRAYCFINHIKYISYDVHSQNKAALATHKKRKPLHQYKTFQYEV